MGSTKSQCNVKMHHILKEIRELEELSTKGLKITKEYEELTKQKQNLLEKLSEKNKQIT